MPSEKKAILIPNFNGEGFISCTVKQFANNFPGHLIVVVDDCSTDSSIAVLRGETSCILLQRDSNGGFAASVNTGLRYLIKYGFDRVLVANSDLIVNSETAKRITYSFDLFGIDQKVAILGFCELGVSSCGINENVSGFLFAMRLSLVGEIGFFDETFYMYGEEQDYFLRVVDAGYIILQTNIKVAHYKEGSGGGLNTSRLAIRNALYLQVKRRLWWRAFRTFAILFASINRIYFPKNYEGEPSYKRITRPGILKGNFYLIAAVIWNITNVCFKCVSKQSSVRTED